MLLCKSLQCTRFLSNDTRAHKCSSKPGCASRTSVHGRFRTVAENSRNFLIACEQLFPLLLIAIVKVHGMHLGAEASRCSSDPQRGPRPSVRVSVRRSLRSRRPAALKADQLSHTGRLQPTSSKFGGSRSPSAPPPHRSSSTANSPPFRKMSAASSTHVSTTVGSPPPPSAK